MTKTQVDVITSVHGRWSRTEKERIIAAATKPRFVVREKFRSH